MSGRAGDASANGPGSVDERPLALVTGAAGFIGRHLVRRLEARYRVLAAGRRCPIAAVTAADLATIAEPLELVVHCAGSSSVGASMQHPLADFAQTVPPTAELLEYLRLHQPGARLVVMSSAAVYGSAARQPIGEDLTPAPVSPYGHHKWMAEQLCRGYGQSYGVRSVCIRFFSVYGAGLARQLLWDACNKALRGETAFSGSGRERRDWLHVDDACELVLAAAALASPAVPIVNGGSGLGTEVRAVVEPIFAALAPSLRPAFDGVRRAGDPAEYVADIARARALGWRPTVALERGIGDYVQWFREAR